VGPMGLMMLRWRWGRRGGGGGGLGGGVWVVGGGGGVVGRCVPVGVGVIV